MRRNAVLALSLLLSLCCVIVPLVAEAQRSGKMYRIGVLGAGYAAHYAQRMDGFRQGLRELDWINERAITFEERWADGRYEQLPRLAAELVALSVDLTFTTGGTPALEAAMNATRDIPIVRSSQDVSQSLA